MKQRELLARIEELERRVESLEARLPQWTYTVPQDNGTWWPGKDTIRTTPFDIELTRPEFNVDWLPPLGMEVFGGP